MDPKRVVFHQVKYQCYLFCLQSDKYPGRNNLARELKLNDVDNTSGSPLLAEVIKRLSPVTNGEVKTSPRQSAADSPRSTSPPNSNKVQLDGNLNLKWSVRNYTLPIFCTPLSFNFKC